VGVVLVVVDENYLVAEASLPLQYNHKHSQLTVRGGIHEFARKRIILKYVTMMFSLIKTRINASKTITCRPVWP